MPLIAHDCLWPERSGQEEFQFAGAAGFEEKAAEGEGKEATFYKRKAEGPINTEPGQPWRAEPAQAKSANEVAKAAVNDAGEQCGGPNHAKNSGLPANQPGDGVCFDHRWCAPMGCQTQAHVTGACNAMALGCIGFA